MLNFSRCTNRGVAPLTLICPDSNSLKGVSSSGVVSGLLAVSSTPICLRLTFIGALLVVRLVQHTGFVRVI